MIDMPVNMKILVGILIIFTSLTGCDQNPRNGIEKVLNDCAEIREQVNASSMNSIQATYYISGRMEQMKITDCPNDFQNAFRKHIVAWRKVADMSAHPSTSLDKIKSAKIDSSFNPFSFPPPEQNELDLYHDVNLTYGNLVEIAERYGAKIPRSIIEK